MSEPKVLHLTLKKKWFDMVASGEKKEEYREYKPYWKKRLFNYELKDFGYLVSEKKFDIVEFRNGYSKDSPNVKVKCERVCVDSKGNPEWGFDSESPRLTIVIKLGDIITEQQKEGTK